MGSCPLHHLGTNCMSTVRRRMAALLACMFSVSAATAMVPFGAESRYDTAEYALGSHTLNVVFIQDDLLRDPANVTHPESDSGQVIHWTDAELTSRRERIVEAASFWSNESALRHHPAAALDVSINWVNDGNPITVADIGGNGSNVGYDDALARIDNQYANLGGIEATWRFNDDTRRSLGTNWASTVFVKPYNGRASAFLNGPYVNAHEDDSAWTYAHELGHIFGALDEFGSAQTDRRSGYLHAFNSNAANLPDGSPNPDSVPAIMKTRDNYSISDGTLFQIGWADTDNDSIPDILDTIPSLSLDDSASQASAGLLNVTIDTRVTPLRSPDPNEGDYTINTIKNVEYRLNGGDWENVVIPASLGGHSESLELNIPDLESGTHILDVRVFNSVDNFNQNSIGFFSTRLLGDFSNDGIYDCTDIDALVAAVSGGTNDTAFDINGDGVVGFLDVRAWLDEAGRTNFPGGGGFLPADANLDGFVDATDFNAWNANKFTSHSGWCGGDFNADGFTDASDFNIWNSYKFRASADGFQAVPEPAGLQMSLVFMAWLMCVRRYRKD